MVTGKACFFRKTLGYSFVNECWESTLNATRVNENRILEYSHVFQNKNDRKKGFYWNMSKVGNYILNSGQSKFIPYHEKDMSRWFPNSTWFASNRKY